MYVREYLRVRVRGTVRVRVTVKVTAHNLDRHAARQLTAK